MSERMVLENRFYLALRPFCVTFYRLPDCYVGVMVNGRAVYLFVLEANRWQTCVSLYKSPEADRLNELLTELTYLGLSSIDGYRIVRDFIETPADLQRRLNEYLNWIFEGKPVRKKKKKRGEPQ